MLSKHEDAEWLIDRHGPARILKYCAHADSGAEHAFDLSADPAELHDLLNSSRASNRSNGARG